MADLIDLTEATEAAALALFHASTEGNLRFKPGALTTSRDIARTAVEAAAPLLVAEGRRQAAEAIRADDTDWYDTANDHFARIAEGEDDTRWPLT